jgi:hypothetical protein
VQEPRGETTFIHILQTSLFLFRPETPEHGHNLTSSVFVVVYPKLIRRSCQCSVSHIPNINQNNMGFSFHFVAVYSFGEIAIDLRPLGLSSLGMVSLGFG